MNAFELAGVSKRYGAMTVLENLDLTLAEGEVLGLFGHNGAGKTTTMKIILGLLAASEGRVCVLGGTPDSTEVRRSLGYLPENVSFYPQLSGRETLHYFARLKGASRAQSEELLEQVGLAHAADRRVRTYSKGMRQRLGLAQALLGSPRLLLLDEPTVGLDPIATRDLYTLIDRLRRSGTAIVLCSHVLPGVEAHIDRAAILASGRLEAIGSLVELRAAAGLPSMLRARGLVHGESRVAQWNAEGLAARSLGADGIEVAACNGHKLALLRDLLDEESTRDIEIHEPTLEDLYRHYMQRSQGRAL